MMNVSAFIKILSQAAYRHSSYAEVYSDFLDWTIGCFLVDGDKPLAERLQNKYGNDYKYFKELFTELISIYNITLKDDAPHPDFPDRKISWCDPLGTIYEEISSKYKSSALGQFFTPKHVCDFMALITITDTASGKLIREPCAGSGRMILAANSVAIGNYYSAVDLDPMCAKMTAINMTIHGITGQVNCGDALFIHERWNFGYEVNYHLQWSGVPTLLPLKKEDSLEVKSFISMIDHKRKPEVIPKPLAIPDIVLPPQYVERTLF